MTADEIASPYDDSDPAEATAEDLANEGERDDLGTAIPVSGLPSAPRASATRRLAESLMTHTDMSEAAAWAIARACARPEDARRRLTLPVVERVPGGTLYTISTQLFSAAVSSYPVNLREAVDRKYAFAGTTRDSGGFSSLSQVSSEEGPTSELIVRSQSREHVVASLKRSQAFLAEKNKYDESIAKNGVLREVFVVPVVIYHADGSPPAATLGSADGSSRVASCHRLTSVTPDQVIYGWPSDDRRFRTMLGRELAKSDLPEEQLTPEERDALRALVIPGRIAIRYVPDEESELTFAQAVRFVVGLTHVDPPTPWDKASELDALAESVLDELVRKDRINQEHASYLGGDMDPEEAVQAGFSRQADERAAHIYRTMLDPVNVPLCKNGIRRVTAKATVKREKVVDVTAELALRAWRPTLDRSQSAVADGVRSATQRAMRLSELSKCSWNVTRRSPEEIRDAALAELDNSIVAGPAAIEIAVLGAWHLLTTETMKREISASHDKRALDKVLRAMLSTRHGLHQLAAAVRDGRDGRAPRPVDDAGLVIHDIDLSAPRAMDDWIRRTWAETTAVETHIDDAETVTPEFELLRAKEAVVAAVDRLDTAVKAVNLVDGARRALILEQGWNDDEVVGLTDRLDEVQRLLRTWGAIYTAAAALRMTFDDSDT